MTEARTGSTTARPGGADAWTNCGRMALALTGGVLATTTSAGQAAPSWVGDEACCALGGLAAWALASIIALVRFRLGL